RRASASREADAANRASGKATTLAGVDRCYIWRPPWPGSLSEDQSCLAPDRLGEAQRSLFPARLSNPLPAPPSWRRTQLAARAAPPCEYPRAIAPTACTAPRPTADRSRP